VTVIRRRDGYVIVLTPYGVAGRSPEASVRLTSAAASFEHAAFHLLEGAWTLRDLGSRNGTFLNGVALTSGERARLSTGDLSRFGDAREEWRFEETPDPPTGDHPLLLETSSVRPRTTLDRVALRFTVSSDGRDVSVALSIPSERHEDPLGMRAGFHLLHWLARARLDDRAGGLPPSEEGWRPRAMILDALGMTKNRLSVESHRLRELFEQRGVVDASSLIELRRGAATLRLGVDDLTID
jgi:pSer/pThr/pTyr-binding forkhead associated (FHA) protein